MIGLDHRSLFEVARELAAGGTEGLLVSGGSTRSGGVPLERHFGDLRRIREELGLEVIVHSGVVSPRLLGEWDALEMIGRYPVSTLILVVLTPLVGRYQSLPDELDQDACARLGVQVGRRPTGGGAIVMTPGQLGVAVTARAAAQESPRETLVRYAGGVIAGLAELGITAQFRHKNDLETGGRKIAGLGLYLDPAGAVLFHASVLADLDVARMHCGYCGLARSRDGAYQDKSFIRVDWPLVSADQLVERMEAHAGRLERLCISMVTHGQAYQDTLEIARRIRARVATPLSILVAPPTLTRARLQALREAGVDMIGIGLDAVTEALFRAIRGDVPRGGLDWHQYWDVVDWSRQLFGPWKVNCHTLVGLGETDRDLMAIFARLLDRQVFSHLFCFNPEPDSRMADHPRSPVARWRRIQLAKYLLEEVGVAPDAFRYDHAGGLTAIAAPRVLVDRAVEDGWAFMTSGCPGETGRPGCTRPMGSWRPSEAPRDYPYRPEAGDTAAIRDQLDLDALVIAGPAPSPTTLAPPAAGRSPEPAP